MSSLARAIARRVSVGARVLGNTYQFGNYLSRKWLCFLDVRRLVH